MVDTTGAGDAFFAGVCVGLTYGKTMREACAIGTRLSSTVICTSENICPRFMPEEFDLDRYGEEYGKSYYRNCRRAPAPVNLLLQTELKSVFG